jgi:tetratricopeptide (TPR) repeat protein
MMMADRDDVRAEHGELQSLALAFDRAAYACDRDAAEAYARTILRGWPAQGAVLNGVARELAKLGAQEIAIQASRAACATPQCAGTWLMRLASLERQAGNLDDAFHVLKTALAQDPGMADAWIELAGLHLMRAEPSAAGAALDRAFALGASSLDLHVYRSVIAANADEFDVALEHARAAVSAEPTSLVAQINAAMIEGSICGYDVALARLDALPPQSSSDVTLLRARAGALLKLNRFAAALEAADAAIAGDPTHPLGREIRVAALKGLGRETEALVELEAPAGTEVHPRLLVQAAALNLDNGQRDRAHQLLRQALAREPGLVSAWYNLGEAGAFDTDGADIAAMQALLERDATTAYDRTLLHFSLGKAFLARDEHARAFEHFVAGNAAKRRRLTRYDVANDEHAMVQLTREFPASVLTQPDLRAHPTELPVFVVGMPRSGTSLVEQMLASHPAVYGAGELSALPDAVAQRASTDRANWRLLAERYLQAAQTRAGVAERITDKLPLNFLNVGFIRLLFPNARIIHCRRDPVDCGLSCFTTLFEEGNEFSFDLTELGRFIRAYHALMNHWRAVMPPDRFIEVDYEAIVADVETEARRLVAFCGLPWHASITTFYDTQRTVNSASRLQVRQPIYRTSVNRAAAFGVALDPLRDALAGRPLIGQRPTQ